MLGPRPDYCLQRLNFLNFTTLVEDGNLGGGLRVENGEKERTGAVRSTEIFTVIQKSLWTLGPGLAMCYLYGKGS